MPASSRAVLFALLFTGIFACAAPVRALCCSAAPSQPAAALFFPNEVQITVEESAEPDTLPSGGKGFVLVLAPGAKRESFLLSVNGEVPGDYYWLEDKEEREAVLFACRNLPVPSRAALPENERSPERRTLLEKLLPLAEAAASREGELAAAENRLALWKKTLQRYGEQSESQHSFVEEAVRLDNSYAVHYPILYVEIAKTRRALEDARQSLAKAQKALNDFDHATGNEILVLPFAGIAQAKASLRYSYVLPAASSLNYRLDARPEKGELSIAQDAELSQNSGFFWKGVDLYVSTAPRDNTLSPKDLPPWQMFLRDKSNAAMSPPVALRKKSASPIEEAPLAQAPLAGFSDERIHKPESREQSIYRLWHVGKRDLVQGVPAHLPLASDVYPAKFYYTLRPMNSPRGFLTAEFSLPASLELPPGRARFSVDGVPLGGRVFSFHGNKGQIFFGADPQVVATMRDLRQASGEQGFFTKEQTRSWHWQITVKNTRSKPISIVLEDPAPVARDDSLTVVTQSMPKPEEALAEPGSGGVKIYRWKSTLNPKEPLVIDHRIQLVAPLAPNKELFPGR